MSSIMTESPAVTLATDSQAGRSSENTAARLRGRSQVRIAFAVCLILAVSGVSRYLRDRSFDEIARQSAFCPFPLDQIPRTIGHWRALADGDSVLDPEVARTAGSSAHILRTYTNESTGEVVKALILYGLANQVFAHTPEACYPAAGFIPVGKRVDHSFPREAGNPPGKYRIGFYSKSVGGATQYVEALSTYFHRDEWVVELAPRWKSFRYHPGMFKIQLERVTTSLSAENSPSESLLIELAHFIESHAKAAMVPAEGFPAAVPTAR